MFDFLRTLDRRWVFLLMGLAIAVPILLQLQFREHPSRLVETTFELIDELKPGDRVLLSFDFDPASEGELGPMATAFVRHCCEKRLKMYFIALWPVGPQLVENTIENVIRRDFPELVYGEDYVNLGFKSGGEAVIKGIVVDLKQLYTTDMRGTNIDQIPMCRGLRNIREMKRIISVSTGFPGIKEWVQYAGTRYPEFKVIGGCTGVQAPYLYPYIPEQLPGLLGAIKGAAEYEELLRRRYGTGEDEATRHLDPRYTEGIRRMGPQLIAHLLMIGLIVVGNVIYFVQRARG